EAREAQARLELRSARELDRRDGRLDARLRLRVEHGLVSRRLDDEHVASRDVDTEPVDVRPAAHVGREDLERPLLAIVALDGPRRALHLVAARGELARQDVRPEREVPPRIVRDGADPDDDAIAAGSAEGE